MPPAAPQPQRAAPPPHAAEAPEQNAEDSETKADTSAPPPPPAPQPRGPLPSANPLRARAPKPGNGADAGRDNREESAPEPQPRPSGLPPPELLEELKAELEPSQSPLAPRIPEAPAEEDEDGRDAAAGLVALLERGLPRAQLVETCLAAWRQSEAVRLPEESWKELEALARTAREPAAGYEAVRAAIAARRS